MILDFHEEGVDGVEMGSLLVDPWVAIAGVDGGCNKLCDITNIVDGGTEVMGGLFAALVVERYFIFGHFGNVFASKLLGSGITSTIEASLEWVFAGFDGREVDNGALLVLWRLQLRGKPSQLLNIRRAVLSSNFSVMVTLVGGVFLQRETS